MPEDMSAAPDHDGLAAEYVLGTLDADERAAARELIAQDAAFAGKVKVWERRLGELHLMVDTIEPEAEVWARIRARLPEPAAAPAMSEPAVAEPAPAPLAAGEPLAGPEPEAEVEPQPSEPTLTPPEFKFDLEFAPPAAPAAEREPELPLASESPAPPAPPEQGVEPAPPDEPGAQLERVEAPPPAAPLPDFIAPKPQRAPAGPDGEQRLRALRRRLAGWRALAAVFALVLCALAGLLATWRYAPQRLPVELRPAALIKLAGANSEARSRPALPSDDGLLIRLAGTPAAKGGAQEAQFDE